MGHGIWDWDMGYEIAGTARQANKTKANDEPKMK